MTTTTTAPSRTDARRPADRPVTIFRITAGLIVLGILSGVGGLADLIGPWVQLRDAAAGVTPELHRWHQADISALVSLLACGALVASIPRPRERTAAVQAALLVTALLACTALWPLNVDALVPSLAVAMLLVATYPDRRALLRIGSAGQRGPLRYVAVATVPPLLVNAVVNIQRQLAGGGRSPGRARPTAARGAGRAAPG